MEFAVVRRVMYFGMAPMIMLILTLLLFTAYNGVNMAGGGHILTMIAGWTAVITGVIITHRVLRKYIKYCVAN